MKIIKYILGMYSIEWNALFTFRRIEILFSVRVCDSSDLFVADSQTEIDGFH